MNNNIGCIIAECRQRGGEAFGLQCHFKPDVYMLSILLTFGTFALAYGLNIFRRTYFLNSMVHFEILKIKKKRRY